MHGRNLFKVLGISMLAAIGVMAVSASAAQAKWVLNNNGSSVGSLVVTANLNLGVMLVPGLLGVHCTGGTASATLETKESGAKLVGSGSALFTGCKVKDSVGNVNNNCTVNSPGEPAGSIKASGSGEGKMEGTKTFATLTSANFTEVLISGALCPLDEEDATVNGSATLTLDTAATLAALHVVLLDDQALNYGENEALLHDGAEVSKPVSGSATLGSGNPWAVQLTGL